jgi:hypothetical protein
LPKFIESVYLKDFGPIKEETIEFSMLHSIRGSNASGKTICTYEALYLVLYGDDFPIDFVRWGQKEAIVRVKFTDGTWIQRTRSGAKQSCTTYDGINEVTNLTVKDIKDIVRAFTGFDTICFDKGKTPESLQFIPVDAPQTFLIAGLAPESVLKWVNTIIGGGEIDLAKQKLAKELRALDTEIKLTQKHVDEESSTLALYPSEDALSTLRKNVGALEDLAIRETVCRTDAQHIDTTINEWCRLDNATEVYGKLSAVATEGVSKLKTMAETIASNEDKILKLALVIKKSDRLKKVQSVLNAVTVDLSKITEMSTNAAVNNETKNALLHIVAAFARNEMELLEVRRELADVQALKVEATKTAPICETCKRPL